MRGGLSLWSCDERDFSQWLEDDKNLVGLPDSDLEVFISPSSHAENPTKVDKLIHLFHWDSSNSDPSLVGVDLEDIYLLRADFLTVRLLWRKPSSLANDIISVPTLPSHQQSLSPPTSL